MKLLKTNKIYIINFGTSSFDEVKSVFNYGELKNQITLIMNHFPKCDGFYCNIREIKGEKVNEV